MRITLLLFTMTALVLAGCRGGGDVPRATPSVQVTGSDATPAGFLARATATPSTTPAPGQRGGGNGNCPPLPMFECAQPGDTLNLYRDLRMNRAVGIEARFYKAPYQYVLDPVSVQTVLRALDRDASSSPIDRATFYAQREGPVGLTLQWERGADPFADPIGGYRVDLSIDLGRDVLAGGSSDVAWQVPPQLGELLARYLSDVSPTPEPSFTPTPAIVPAGAVFFSHPDDTLTWDGPDDSVSSRRQAHCGSPELLQDFGVPAYIGVADRLGFWSIAAIPRREGWHATGYQHEGWQILQGDDATRVYLALDGDDRIAFEYMAYGCI